MIGYSTNNKGPYLVTEPTKITVQKNIGVIYKLGQIIDDENDDFFLDEWSLSTGV